MIPLSLLVVCACAVFACGACAGSALLALIQEKRRPRPAPAETPRHGLQGTMDALSLGALLQLLEQERRSASITLRCGESLGWIVCLEGQIARARLEEQRILEGGAAVRGMLAWDAGSYVLTPGRVETEGPRLPITPLLIESARRDDEEASGLQAL